MYETGFALRNHWEDGIIPKVFRRKGKIYWLSHLTYDKHVKTKKQACYRGNGDMYLLTYEKLEEVEDVISWYKIQ